MLVTFMDLIEQQDGPDVRDAWIHLLPVSATHCFDCGSWPDDAANGIPELAPAGADDAGGDRHAIAVHRFAAAHRISNPTTNQSVNA